MAPFMSGRLGVRILPLGFRPYNWYSLAIYCDTELRPMEDHAHAEFAIHVYVSGKAATATFRIRRLGDDPWWESDRRWTFDRTTKVFEFAREHAQALCDEFGLQLMLPDPVMDEPLPGRYRKLDPNVPATLFSEMFSEM
jgi:hypothetical protein